MHKITVGNAIRSLVRITESLVQNGSGSQPDNCQSFALTGLAVDITWKGENNETVLSDERLTR